eukprot:5381124-Pleurochrysis_carterae.AAC.2
MQYPILSTVAASAHIDTPCLSWPRLLMLRLRLPDIARLKHYVCENLALQVQQNSTKKVHISLLSSGSLWLRLIRYYYQHKFSELASLLTSCKCYLWPHACIHTALSGCGTFQYTATCQPSVKLPPTATHRPYHSRSSLARSLFMLKALHRGLG